MSAIFPTSGPWQTKHDFDLEGRTTVIGNVDVEIIDGTTHHMFDFVCTTLDDGGDNQSLSIAVANARLIAAAPDLLEACKAFLLYNDRPDTEPNAGVQMMVDYDHALTLARAALTKAEGRA